MPPSHDANRPTTIGTRPVSALTRQKKPKRWLPRLWKWGSSIAIVLSAAWLTTAFWYELAATPLLRWPLIAVVALLALALLLARHKPSITGTSAKRLGWLYTGIWLLGLIWFVSLAPQQQRDWKPEVAEVLHYERDANNPNLVTLHNVRNFDWQTAETADEHWQTRQVDLSKLTGVDIANAYWMGPLIAHTLVSFHFEDAQPLSFSFEIRKEKNESFSAIGGFFKQYELSLVAAEERDIIYTRTNARGEQVYLFPIDNLTKAEIQKLFEAYLTAADDLQAQPQWYNTLTSNCTNIIFYMAHAISGGELPWDYRVWVSGWLPNYLYDLGILPNTPNTNSAKQAAIANKSAATEQNSTDNNDQNNQDGKWSMDEWYRQSHINPKTKSFSAQDNQSVDAYSKLIRQGLPKAVLMQDDSADTP